MALAAVLVALGAPDGSARAQTAPTDRPWLDAPDLRGTTTGTTADPKKNPDPFAPAAMRPVISLSDPEDAAPSSADPAGPDPDARPGTVAGKSAVAPPEATDFPQEKTGTIDALAASEEALADGEAGFGRMNLRTTSIDGLPTRRSDGRDDAPGLRLGTMVLRPTVTEKLVHETVRDGGGTSSRLYSETTLGGSLESDWARHRLTIDGTGTLQKNLSGTGQEEPSARLSATLDLDLTRQTTGQVSAGYEFYREDRTDPNAISGADAQAAVHTFSGGAALKREFGRLRGTAAVEVSRTVFGDAALSGGGVVSGADRDRISGKATARIGYEISPALIPFLEASAERTRYDLAVDDNGFARSASTYAVRAGVEFPYSDKIAGELAAGYALRDIDDAALADIDAFTLDGKLNWSPVRGTMVNAGFATTLEAATAAGESGSVAYRLSLGIERELRRTVVARLTGTALYRDYTGAADLPGQTTYGAAAEIDWSVNRYLSLVGDAGYERTVEAGAADSDSVRLGLGLRLRR